MTWILGGGGYFVCELSTSTTLKMFSTCLPSSFKEVLGSYVQWYSVMMGEISKISSRFFCLFVEFVRCLDLLMGFLWLYWFWKLQNVICNWYFKDLLWSLLDFLKGSDVAKLSFSRFRGWLYRMCTKFLCCWREMFLKNVSLIIYWLLHYVGNLELFVMRYVEELQFKGTWKWWKAKGSLKMCLRDYVCLGMLRLSVCWVTMWCEGARLVKMGI